MNEVFFTSDHHFFHKNIIRFSNRPFDDLESMHEVMIERWNEVVKRGDRVYHLGDIAFLRNGQENSMKTILGRLNGDIYYVLGNHDKNLNLIADRFIWVKNFAEIKIDDADAHSGRRGITLCHYAMRVWNKSHHGSYHLYGHSHGSLPDDPNARSFDVGVDTNNFYPYSYEDVKEIMDKKDWQPIDHHGARSFEIEK